MKYPGNNLKRGLKCLEYDENIPSNEARENVSIPQEVVFNFLEVNILEINQEKQYVLLGYKVKVSWYDHRLQWPIECQNQRNQTKFYMVRSEILNNLWNPVAEAQEKALKGDPVMEKTITIGQVNPCT